MQYLGQQKLNTGKHVATAGIDSCRFRHNLDKMTHDVVINNGGFCEHSHSAWEACWQCGYEQKGSHK